MKEKSKLELIYSVVLVNYKILFFFKKKKNFSFVFPKNMFVFLNLMYLSYLTLGFSSFYFIFQFVYIYSS